MSTHTVVVTHKVVAQLLKTNLDKIEWTVLVLSLLRDSEQKFKGSSSALSSAARQNYDKLTNMMAITPGELIILGF
jgi:hypothetical protein